MSKLRNTLGTLRRSRHASAAALAAGSLAAGLLAACSSDAHDPTAPSAAHALAASVSATPLPGPGPKLTIDDTQWLNKNQLVAMAPTWHTSLSDTQPGTRLPEPLLCNGMTSASTSFTVNPSPVAQTVQLGTTATLTIPANAVPSTVTITASSTVSQAGISFDFQPHGYQFSKAITISANYQGCGMRYSTPLNLFYMNDSGGIIQTMPSVDDRSSSTLQALTDHFSHYMIAWS